MSRGILSKLLLISPAVLLAAGQLPAAGEASLTTETALRQAIRLTAKGRYESAERLYRDLATSSPAEGYPALARFLARTGKTTAAKQLMEDATLQQLPAGVRARVAVAAGVPKAAVELLLQAEGVENSYEQTLLLANQLEALGRKEEASRILDRAIRVAGMNVYDRRDLFQRLIQIGDMEALERNLPALVENLVTSSTLSYEEIRDLANTGLNAVASSSNYQLFLKSLDSAKGHSAAQAWIGAIAAIKRGDVAKAYKDLEEQTSRTLTMREKLVIHEELARLIPEDYARTYKLYTEIIPVAPDADRLRIPAAQAAYFLRNYEDALRLLNEVDRSKLADVRLEPYLITKLRCIAAGRPPAELVRAYEEAVVGLNWTKMTDLARKSFDRIPETEQHLKVKEALDARLKETTAPSQLHILEVATYGELRDWDGVIEAMGAYVEANPDDTLALEEYSDNVTLRAYRLVASAQETTPTEEKKKSQADAAAKALWRLIEAKPYVPDNYAKLMELYRLYGQLDKAKAVPLRLVSGGTSATAERWNLAAYVYAKNGYAEEAIPLYQEALKLEPDNAKYLFNYVGALRRASRLAEAQKILFDLVKRGVHGRQYNSDDLFAVLYDTAEKQNDVSGLVAFLEGLIADRSVPEHSQVLVMSGDVLGSHGHVDLAMKFYEALRTQYPEQAELARQKLLEAHVAKKDFASAEQLLNTMEKESTSTADIIAMRYGKAFLKSESGDFESAVKQWKDLAEEFPKERAATRGLVTAAQIYFRQGSLDEARKLVEQYLALEVGDNDVELAAREILNSVHAEERKKKMMQTLQSQTSGTVAQGSK